MRQGEVYKIVDHNKFRSSDEKYEYIKIERWDRSAWVIKFLTGEGQVDWTFMTNDRLQSLFAIGAIRYIDPAENLYFAIKELEKQTE